MKKQFLEIGKVVAVHGIRGDVRVQYYCDSADDICDFERLYFDKGRTEISITRAAPHKNVVLMKITGIDTIEQAQPLVGKTLYVNRDDTALDDGQYFIQDIIGISVKNADTGADYGKISEVLQNGGTDVYVVKKEDGTENMFPAADEFIVSTDIDAGEMLIRPIPGMFDDGAENGDEN